MLTDAQIAFYREQGYLLVEDVFTAEELAELNRVTDGFIHRARGATESDATFDLAPDHSAEHPKVRRVKNPTRQHPAYDRAMRNPRLLAILQDLLGPAVRFDHAKLNIKPVGGGAAIEWHQDWAFYPHSNDDLLAVGVFLEDVKPESGPLMVIPGSHKGAVHDHHHEGVFVGAIDPAVLSADRERAVALTGPAGAVTLHHVRTLHASSENRGDRARRLLLFSYAAADAWPLVPEEPLEAFDARLIAGQPTLAPRMEAVPVRLPLPRRPAADSIFKDQASVAGRSFAQAT